MEENLKTEQAEEMIFLLAYMRLKPCMFFSPCTTQGIITWWNGFASACQVFGIKFDNEVDKLIYQKGWEGGASAPFVAMRDAGLSENEMIIEYITILIQAIQMKTGIGNEAILKCHNEVRQRYESFGDKLSNKGKQTLQLMEKIESDIKNET
jgi:hypothetical protein